MFKDGHRESYYKSGELKSWSTQNRDSCMRLEVPYCIDYYRSGNYSTKYFQLPNRFVALVGYEDEKNGEISGGRMYHNQSKFRFENNRLVEIRSERKKIPIETPYMPSGDPKAPRSSRTHYAYEEDVLPYLNNHYRMKNTVRGSCVAKGEFEYFELQNGFIYYYNENGDRELTEKVVDGKIQYNPKVEFQQEELEWIVRKFYDRNFNGFAEKREVEKVDWFRLSLPDSSLLDFQWSEIFLFKNLKELIVNDRLYKMNAYMTVAELKSAVLNERGSLIQPQEQVLPPPPLPDPNPEPEFIAFPDTSASFIGGEKLMQDWLRSHLVYPEESKNRGNQGVVYIEFFVLKDGTIENVNVIRGVDPFIDSEAKSLIEKMPKWKPAKNEGKKVVSKVRLPIRFALD